MQDLNHAKTVTPFSGSDKEKLSALSPSEKRNPLISIACHREMLEVLAKM